jgi:succinate dehydrogenase/fumarate reductase flavoprotein subunit
MKEETFDVVVIGGGGSGLAAASEAARLGAQVLLIEKNAQLGGSTAWSVGSVSATQTRHQKKAGILDDCPDWHFEDLGKFAGPLEARDNLVLRRILVDESPGMFEWLMESGLVFWDQPANHRTDCRGCTTLYLGPKPIPITWVACVEVWVWVSGFQREPPPCDMSMAAYKVWSPSMRMANTFFSAPARPWC